MQKADVAKECRTLADIPSEKYSNCESKGGKLATKTDDNGCLIVLECVGAQNQDTNNTNINKQILTDKASLLGFALKIESVKMNLASVL